VFGLGAPAWAVTGWALALLLAVARYVAALPYAVMAMPAISGALFVSTMLGLLWLMLWRGRLRWPGAVVVLIGAVLMAMTPAPDILVTADGRHIAVRTGRDYALLRDRAGDYMRDTLAESAGFDGAFDALAGLPAADCSIDVCAITVEGQGGGRARLLATRTNVRLPWRELVAACAASDIVVSDRRLPRGCAPLWLKLDRQMLAANGGALILLRDRRLITGRDPQDRHPWVIGRAGR